MDQISTKTGTDLSPGKLLAVTVAGTSAACLVIPLVGSPVAAALGAAAFGQSLWLAAAACWIGALAAALPPAFCARSQPGTFAAAVLGSLLVRFATTLGVALVMPFATTSAKGDGFLIAVGAIQAVVLAFDVVVLITLNKNKFAAGPRVNVR